jgi:hypothetical protein
VDRVSEIGLFDSGHHPAIDFLSVQIRRFPQGQSDIFVNVHGVEKGVALEHVTDLCATGYHLLLFHRVEGLTPQKNSALVGFDQPDDVLEQKISRLMCSRTVRSPNRLVTF